MIGTIRSILAICTLIAGLFCLFYIGAVISAIWNKLRHGRPIGNQLSPVRPFTEIYCESSSFLGRLCAVLLACAVLVGACYWVADEFFSTKEIGSLLEQRGEYDCAYEAYVYINGSPVFCIADMSKRIDVHEDRNGRTRHSSCFYISAIHLPYGKTDSNVESYYYPKQESNSVYLGLELADSYKIEVGSVATDRSYEVLASVIVSSHGEFCGSKQSNIYHLPSCPSVKEIHSENLIYFANKYEADALQYTLCSRCSDRI